MKIDNIEFKLSGATLQPDGVKFSHVALYRDGKFLRMATFIPELLQAMQQKGTVRFDLNSVEEMEIKNSAITTLKETL